MKKLLSGFLLSLVLLLQTTPVFAAPGAGDCNWGLINNVQSFCVGGFSSPAEADNYSANVSCVGGAFKCGVGGGTVENTPINHGGPFQKGDNGYYTCLSGNYAQQVSDKVNSCFERSDIGARLIKCASTAAPIVVTVTAAGAVSGGAPGAPIAVLSLGASAAACAVSIGSDILSTTKIINTALTGCSPTFNGQVVDPTGKVVCDTSISPTIQDLKQQVDDQTTIFNLCNQVPPSQTDRLTACQNCAANGGVWTSIGCINYTPTAIIGALVKIGLGIAGGVALLMILAAAFLFSTSQGDPKRTGQAKDMLTSAVIGLLFVIFSVTILQFLGVTILHLPGFGT